MARTQHLHIQDQYPPTPQAALHDEPATNQRPVLRQQPREWKQFQRNAHEVPAHLDPTRRGVVRPMERGGYQQPMPEWHPQQQQQPYIQPPYPQQPYGQPYPQQQYNAQSQYTHPIPVPYAQRPQVRRKNLLALISAIIATLWLVFVIVTFSGLLNSVPQGDDMIAAAATIGTGIGFMLQLPSLVLTFLGVIFNWCGWGFRKRGLVLTAAILFCIAFALGIGNFFGLIPSFILAFIAFGQTGQA